MIIHDEVKLILQDNEIVVYVENKDVIRIEYSDKTSAKEQYDFIFSDFSKCSEELKETLEENNIVYSESDTSAIEDANKFMSRMQLLTEFKFLQEKGESELTKMIFDEEGHEELIKLFALQYYHVTNMCRRSIAAAITTLHGKQKIQAIEFFEEELGHERLLKRSLSSVGIDELSDETILPSTLALMNRLRYCSIVDPLSFMAIIFLYEGSAEDGLEYISSLERHDFSDEFILPQKKHEDINTSGDHDKVSLDFYRSIPFINHSNMDRVESVIKGTIDIEYKMHEEIVKEYEKRRKLH
ncbi:iron-containing redox enzyme family protein [Vibrio mimicus]